MPYIRAQVSDDAYDGWRFFADQHGISVSSLVEAAGGVLAEWAREVATPGPIVERVIAAAREIDAERRRRR